jgi:ribosome biogenesis GTPase
MEGTVTKITSALCEVDAGGKTYTCQARGRVVESDTGESKPLVVGDRVIITPIDEDEGVVERVLPRTTKLSRRSPRGVHTEHVIAANVDQLVIVAAVRKPPLTPGIIDRYIIAGEAGLLDIVVCVNKIDLARDPGEYEGVAQAYRDMEYPVLLTSAETGAGIDELKAVLHGKSSVLAGHSGVGKSSLLNAIQPGLRLRTGEVDYKGRHTTTWASLLKLDGGGYVVDTPGIREFALWDIEKHEVAQFFPRIWELSHDCRMPDCVHMHEPGCAVMAAVESGEYPEARYNSYVRIVETTEQPDVPRNTDVDEPEEQITKSRREPSRRKRKQDMRRLARLDWEDVDEDEMDDYL